MIYIDDISVTPNPVDAGKSIKIEVTLHEEYENSKRYENRYPYRYGKKGDNQ